MHWAVIVRVTGLLLALFSVILLIPAGIALLYGEAEITTFLTAFGITATTGLAMWLPLRGDRALRGRDGFLITALFYLGLGLFGALPFYFTAELTLTFAEAVFESTSGLTTTGATVITGLDNLPKSILFYRQLLQWFGGMGIIVLAVAVFPMLGIGGLQLYRTESTGIINDNKLTPRIAETAKALWLIYVGLTLICAAAYYLAGMSLFDAVAHSFATIAIGGFSTYDASIGHFNNVAIETIAMIFMVLSGVNFALHFLVWRRRNIFAYFKDIEVRTYLSFLAFFTSVIVLLLWQSAQPDINPLRDGLFQTISMATTTGFTTAPFSTWPSAAPLMLILVAFIGGCAGSTAGGMKVVRVLMLYLQGMREVNRLIHPNGVFLLKLGSHPVSDRVVQAVWSFVAVYGLVFFLSVVLITILAELDFTTAFSAVAACINNLGPGLGAVALHYGDLPESAHWLLTINMVLGRLEIFTILVLLTPAYWRR